MSPRSGRSIYSTSVARSVGGDLKTVSGLIAELPADLGTWDDPTVFTMTNFMNRQLFFCPRLSKLKGKAGGLGRVARKADILGFSEEDFEHAAARQATTLKALATIHTLLEYVAKSTDENVRRLTGGSDNTSFVLSHGDIIPSCHWINRELFRSFRKHFGIKKRELTYLVYGEGGPEVPLSKTINHGIRLNDDEPSYDCLATPFTCEAIYLTLDTIFTAHAPFGKEPFTVMPPREKFFIFAHTAGSGNGQRTLAMPEERGNLLAPLTTALKQDITRRVREFAAGRGNPK